MSTQVFVFNLFFFFRFEHHQHILSVRSSSNSVFGVLLWKSVSVFVCCCPNLTA